MRALDFRPAPAPAIDARPLARVLLDIGAERDRQDAKWGANRTKPDVPLYDGAAQLATTQPRFAACTLVIPDADAAKLNCDLARAAGAETWAHIVVEELCEAVEVGALGDFKALRQELVQTAAVCVAWIEDLDRRAAVNGVTSLSSPSDNGAGKGLGLAYGGSPARGEQGHAVRESAD